MTQYTEEFRKSLWDAINQVSSYLFEESSELSGLKMLMEKKVSSLLENMFTVTEAVNSDNYLKSDKNLRDILSEQEIAEASWMINAVDSICPDKSKRDWDSIKEKLITLNIIIFTFIDECEFEDHPELLFGSIDSFGSSQLKPWSELSGHYLSAVASMGKHCKNEFTINRELAKRCILLSIIEAYGFGNINITLKLLLIWAKDYSEHLIESSISADGFELLEREEVFIASRVNLTVSQLTWIRSNRKAIDVTVKSMMALREVHRRRAEKGLPLIRWKDLPQPGHDFYQVMPFFRWIGVGIGEVKVVDAKTKKETDEDAIIIDPKFSNHVFTFAMSCGIPFNERVDVGLIGKYREKPMNTLLSDGASRFSCISALTLNNDSEKPNNGVTEKEIKGSLSLPPHILSGWELEVMSANALAALNSAIVVTERKMSPKRKRGRRGSRNSNNQRTIRLDEKGLRIWKKEVEYLDELEQRQNRKTSNGKTGRPVPYQYVPEGYSNRWVLKPNPGEKILSTRARTGKQEGVLYLVRRVRKDFHRGDVATPSKSRLACGIDDILVK
jgi:hypothetical protein